MQTTASPGKTRKPLWITLAILAGVLAWLWRASLLPTQMAFSNDAPLGLMSAYSEFRWSAFFGGSWYPIVWLGSPALPLQPSFSNLLYLFLGPILFGKFIAPLSLLLLGMAAFILCRSCGFAAPVGTLVGIAAALNTNLVSHAGWGLAMRSTTVAFTILAIAALSSGNRHRFWSRSILAGIAVGLSVVEGADVGAIFSLYVAAYALVTAWLDLGESGARKAILSLGRLIVVAGCAGWIASYILSTLVGTQIQGVAVLAESAAARQQRWDFVTGWSFPKLEVLRLAIPGIMGYRMDTPEGGAYWGNVGQDGTPQYRFNGGGEYAGVLVLMVAGWAVARAFSRSDRQPYSDRERKLITFWALVSLGSLLLSFGRFAPFYQLVYALPYLSTIRVPMKFLHVVHLGLFILFGYGLQGLWRLHVDVPNARRGSLGEQLGTWWRNATGFDRTWSRTLVVLGAGALAGALIYSAYQPSLAAHIASVGFQGPEGREMARFSVKEVALAAAFVVAFAGLLAAMAAGRFSGGRGLWIASMLGILLAADLGRAAAPFIAHYDYQRRYESNPVVAFLAKDPWEHRVTARIFPDIRQTLTSPKDGTWPAVQNQWMEQQFPYNTIHTADIWQMPRMPELDAAYLSTFRPTAEADLSRIGRMWQLANVRYIIGSRGTEAELNRLFDPTHQSFKPVLGFDLAQKPGAPADGRVGLDDITAVQNPNGQYSVIEYGSALPRAQWFPRWAVIPDNAAALKELASPTFDPTRAVVLDAAPILPGGTPMTSATNAPSSPVESKITHWAPKQVTVHTRAGQPGVLLLNDRWDPNWRATVDGKPVPILRANYLMRAVGVPEGEHVVEFRYRPPMKLLWVTLAALTAALGAGAWMVLGGGNRKPRPDSTSPTSAPGSAKTRAS